MGHFFGAFAFMGIFMILISIAGFSIWIVGLISCLKRNFTNPNDKIVWLIVILFLNAFGSLIYYFVVIRASENKTLETKPVKKDITKTTEL